MWINSLKLVFLVSIILFSACSKEEDMRRILKPDERLKSYIPSLNGQYARMKIKYKTTIYYESIYYRTYTELAKKIELSEICAYRYSYYLSNYLPFIDGIGSNYGDLFERARRTVNE